MEINQSVDITQVEEAIKNAQAYLLSIQSPEGYWWELLESNVTITAEILLLHKIWKTDHTLPLAKIETYFRIQQREHGGWELYYGDGGEISTTVEAYLALKLLGVPVTDPAMVKARDFIIKHGGISKTRIFTKCHLALIGCYSWKGVPSIPPWLMFLPAEFPVNIYEMSSWARGSTVPLIIVFDKQPIFPIEPKINLDELYWEGIDHVQYELPTNSDFSDIFVWLDNLFKLGETLNLVPFRAEGIKAAEKWILERQEVTGDWGGIIPAMFNSMLALKVLDYPLYDPIVQRGFAAIANFAIETPDTYLVQACVSPVWDTALVIRSLIDSGLAPHHPSLVKASEWLLSKQILDYGDWSIKNPQGKPGGWAFEFDNRYYPDVDDSAVVVMALIDSQIPQEHLKKAAIDRAIAWMASMQCHEGGWAAFDKNNNLDLLNYLPYADLKAMIDPNTADVTARVLEMMGRYWSHYEPEQLGIAPHKINQGIYYLRNQQESDGSWFGRWGVNYIYGTSGALTALSLVAPKSNQSEIKRGVEWLLSCQNPDGGWGESCHSYKDPSYKGKGNSTPSQTAWALIGLLAVLESSLDVEIEAIDRGIEYLIRNQRPDGTWYESEFTGTGFPGHFYIKYHLYQQHFPLTALGRYYQIKSKLNID